MTYRSNINNYLKNRELKIKAGLAAAASFLSSQARLLAPVDTGFLRSNINYNIINELARITAHADYSIYLEKGTKYIKAQPYLRPLLGKKIFETAVKIYSRIVYGN